jgi:PKD repeat protein
MPGIMRVAPLARAGSIAAFAIVLALALVPAWDGPFSAVRHASGGPDLGALRTAHDPTPTDLLSASVSAAPPAADLGQSITFTCTASGGTSPYVYAWTLGDGNIGMGSTVSHTYGSTGTYTATCTVTDVLSGVATASANVVISPLPSVTASVNHNLAAPGTTLTFDASSSGGDGSYSYTWSFGDSSSGSGAPTTHAYSQAGSYQASVTLTDGNGGTASDSTSVTISDIAVTADASPTTGDTTTTFTFTASASGGSGSPYTFSWTFGDGTTGSGSPVSHVYSAGGSYSPFVTASDSLGGDMIAQTQGVTVTSPPAPLGASVSAPETAADVGQSITFTCTAAGGTAPYAYGWTFGDGNTASGSVVSHAYQSAGNKAVVCTVTDATPANATASTSVDISPSPAVAANANHAAAAPGSNITFTAQATGGPGTFTAYDWSFGDGTTGTGALISHTYTQTGSFQTTVVVTDGNGGTASGAASVTISNIQVTGSAAPSSGTTETLFQFTSSATGGGGAPYAYAWDFGDGVSGTGAAISHTYSREGNYTPSVRATDALSASRSTALPLVSVTSSSSPPVMPLSATMSISTSLPRVNESISLSGTGHGGAGGYACAWDFGDGRTSTGCATSHAWRTTGHFVVNLSLADSAGNHTWQSGSVDVQSAFGPPGGPLSVSIATSRSLAGVNETVFLVATGGGGSGGYRCSWDFADGNFGTGCSVSYAWNMTGAYNVTLTLTDSSGHNATARQTIEVVTALTVSFGVGPSPAILGETAELIAHPSGGIGPYNCTWDFGDASRASGCTTSHAWRTRGRFVIWLFVNDSMGQYEAVSRSLVVESSGLFGLPIGLDLVVIAAPLVLAAVVIHLWNVWRNRDPIPQGLDSVEASVLTTLVGNVKRLSRWRPGRGARDRGSGLPGEESGPKADEGAGGDDHQDPVQ